MNSAREFIQILEVSDKIPKSQWLDRFQPLYNQYNLKPFGDNEFDLAGKGKKSGISFYSYSSLITVKSQEYVVMYIDTVNADESEQSEGQIIDLISELQTIRFQ